MTEAFAWPAILVLGLWHGINPGMGWLFAVALGMQEGNGRAVWRALPPLALGHGLAVAGTILLAAAVGLVLPPSWLRWSVAGALAAFGIWKLVSRRHPRYGGMRVNGRELTVWSALMASAHGAGLMVVPFVAGRQGARGGQDPQAAVHGHADHLAAMVSGPGAEAALLATLLHTAAYLLVVGLVAVVVYEKLGLRMLRQLWVNLDVLWAVALIATAVLTVV